MLGSACCGQDMQETEQVYLVLGENVSPRNVSEPNQSQLKLIHHRLKLRGHI